MKDNIPPTLINHTMPTTEEMSAPDNKFCKRRAAKMREGKGLKTKLAQHLYAFTDHIFPEDIPEGMTADEVRDERIYHYNNDRMPDDDDDDDYDDISMTYTDYMMDEIIFGDNNPFRP
jgi:hypothetical protein